MQSRRTRLVALLVLAAVPPGAVAAILVAVDFRSALLPAPQASSVWPYDSYHDMRWLLVYHKSWLGFAVEFVLMVLARGVYSGTLSALAWPKKIARPSLRWLIVRNMWIAALVAVIIHPWATLSVVASGISLSWYLLAAVVPMLVVSPFMQRAGVIRRWWQGLPPVELVG